jgi:hypothetical protein
MQDLTRMAQNVAMQDLTRMAQNVAMQDLTPDMTPDIRD